MGRIRSGSGTWRAGSVSDRSQVGARSPDRAPARTDGLPFGAGQDAYGRPEGHGRETVPQPRGTWRAGSVSDRSQNAPVADAPGLPPVADAPGSPVCKLPASLARTEEGSSWQWT